MRLRRSAVVLIAFTLTVILGVGTFSLWSVGGSGPTTAGVKLTATSSGQRPTEMIGGCAETNLDHGHDIDPLGFKDQEDDECVPGQQVLRNPDGVPLSSQPGAN